MLTELTTDTLETEINQTMIPYWFSFLQVGVVTVES